MALRMLPLLALAACTESPEGAGDPCTPGGSEPATVADIIDRIDSLPTPVTLPCLVASLPRPLPLEASSDVFSAQPAVGERSPRMFVRYPGLTLTVVPEGPGAALLEFGEVKPSGLTVKAELEFPVDTPLDPVAPFERVLMEDRAGTVCSTCHHSEIEVGPGRFASVRLQPLPTRVVPLSSIAAEAAACGPSVADDRCALLRALFDHGAVVHAPFPSDLYTLYGPP